ncbi:MAG: hypothetical protein ACYTAF_00595 [Planctomycetota bacterium]|jgi:hypothetical protein
MKALILGLIRLATKVFVFFSAVLMFLLLSLAVVLWVGGGVSAERLQKAVDALRGIEPEVPTVPPGIAQQEWKRIGDYGDEREENLREQEKAMKDLETKNRVLIEQQKQESARLTEREEEFQKARMEFEQEKAAWRQAQEDEKFQDNVKKFTETSPKVTVQIWLSYTEDEIVKYLRAMRSGAVADLFKEMQNEPKYTDKRGKDKDQPSRLDRIMELMK